MNLNLKNTTITWTMSMVLCLMFSGGSLMSQIGIYTVDGDLTMSPSTTTRIQLTDLSGAGFGHDQVAVTGNASIDGTLDIVLAGYTVSDVDQFEIMDVPNGQTGQFSSINWPPEMVNWNIDYGVLNPNKVTIYAPNSPLPIRLEKFDVTVEEDHNLLTWQTASEINNDYFEVEYSRDGKSFYTVGEVKGSGNSTDLHFYSFVHKELSYVSQYYRLKQVDWNGTYSYSQIIAVNRLKSTRALIIYPNPSSGLIHLSKPVNEIKVYDIYGKLVLIRTERIEQVDLSHLTSGMYYIETDTSLEKHIINIHK